MTGTWKITPWVLLVTGLLWVLTVVGNIYVPRLLAFTHLPHIDRMAAAPLQLAVGALCIVVGLGGLRRPKR